MQEILKNFPLVVLNKRDRIWIKILTIVNCFWFWISVQWVCTAEQTLWSSPSTAAPTVNQQTPSNLIKITDFDWCALSCYSPYGPLSNAHCPLPSLNCSVGKYWRKGRHLTCRRRHRCRCRPSVAPIETNEAQKSRGVVKQERAVATCRRLINNIYSFTNYVPTMYNIHSYIVNVHSISDGSSTSFDVRFWESFQF